MNFQPLGKRVLVQREEEANTTSSGIIIPDNAQEKPSKGKVVAVSTEVSELACGEVVVFGKFSGNEISLDGEKFLVLETDDIFGIIKFWYKRVSSFTPFNGAEQNKRINSFYEQIMRDCLHYNL